MTDVDRRRFLQLSGLLAGGALVGACSGSSSGGGTAAGGSGAGSLSWWDQFQPIAEFEKTVFADFAKAKGGASVEYTVQNPDNMARALQLAFQSKQLPDVFTVAGVTLPTSKLREEGWFSPLQLDSQHRSLLPPGTLVEGLNMFGGQPYAFPIFSFRSHDSLVWFNKDLMEKAGLDPANPPVTYDEIRAAARAIRKNGGGSAYGWIAQLAHVDRLNAQLTQLAQAGGAGVSGGGPPGGGIDLRTGEYVLHTDPFVNAIEFLVAMKKDGVMFPASSSLDTRTARARWATGVAGLFFDGSYNIGVLKTGFQQFVDKVGVGSIPVPDASGSVALNGISANPALSLWIAKTSKNADAASRLVSMFAEDHVQVGIAEAMDQPPLITSVLDKADVHATYRKSIASFDKQVFRAPNPVARNTDVAVATAAMQAVDPPVGQIVAGAVTGEIDDWQGALRKLSNDLTAARDEAIAAAKQKGADVSLDDWKFPDWTPGQDYQTKS